MELLFVIYLTIMPMWFLMFGLISYLEKTTTDKDTKAFAKAALLAPVWPIACLVYLGLAGRYIIKTVLSKTKVGE